MPGQAWRDTLCLCPVSLWGVALTYKARYQGMWGVGLHRGNPVPSTAVDPTRRALRHGAQSGMPDQVQTYVGVWQGWWALRGRVQLGVHVTGLLPPQRRGLMYLNTIQCNLYDNDCAFRFVEELSSRLNLSRLHAATTTSSNHAWFHPEPSPIMPADHFPSVIVDNVVLPIDGVIDFPSNFIFSVTHL